MLSLAALAVLVLSALTRGLAWRHAILRGALIWAAVAVVASEVLGAMRALTLLNIGLLWVAVIAWEAPAARRGLASLRGVASFARLREAMRGQRAVVAAIVVIVAGTGATAVLSAPNNYDSLTYHLPRLHHWIQQASLAHYPSNITRQIGLNPGAELLILQVWPWSNGMVLANLVQWIGFALAIVAASLAAARLGGTPVAQALAALFVATLPMAVLQASSTQNDLLTMAWTLVFVDRALVLRRGPTAGVAAEAGLALALAVVTKGTAMVALLPACVVLGLSLLARTPRVWLPAAVLLTVPVLLLNGPWWLRNERLFATPFSYLSAVVGNDHYSLGGVYSNVLRNTASELLSPMVPLNEVIVAGVSTAHDVWGLPLNDPRITGGTFDAAAAELSWHRWLHEDLAGDPVHTLLVMAVLVLLAIRRERSRERLALAACFAASVLLYALLLRWQPWGTRLHLPLFALVAPLVGVTLAEGAAWSRRTWAGALIVSASLPLVANGTRPLAPQAFTGVPPVWATDATVELFRPMPPGALDEYRQVVYAIARRAPASVGLLVDEGTPEYLLWHLLWLEMGSQAPRLVHVLPWLVVPAPPAAPPALIVVVAREVDPVALRSVTGCEYDEVEHHASITLLAARCAAPGTSAP